ncbi:MAG: hypothetical protein GXY34_13985 [Syntrophomonadaceae bacterium]|nr:hypothetical protein [Syntrophomonadaceae bacterium]
MLSEKTHARHLVELGFLEGAFKKMGLETTMIEKNEEMFVHSLVVTMQDYKEREMNVALNFVPLDEEFGYEQAMFLQLYTALPFVWDTRLVDDLGKLILNLNNRVLLGLFGIKEGRELYYRYVFSSSQDDVINTGEFMDNFDLYLLMMNMFEEYVEKVSTGEYTLEQALEEIENM